MPLIFFVKSKSKQITKIVNSDGPETFRTTAGKGHGEDRIAFV
jgi:hypothetical protein